MSNMVPASLKPGAHTTNTLLAKRYLIIHAILIWLSVQPLIIIAAMFLEWYSYDPLYLLIAMPLFLVVSFFIFLFTALFWSALFLKIINLFYTPREGIFPRDKHNRAYRYWSLRAVVKKFPLWISHNSPIPWADNLAFRLFGNGCFALVG